MNSDVVRGQRQGRYGHELRVSPLVMWPVGAGTAMRASVASAMAAHHHPHGEGAYEDQQREQQEFVAIHEVISPDRHCNDGALTFAMRRRSPACSCHRDSQDEHRARDNPERRDSTAERRQRTKHPCDSRQ